MNVEKRFDLEIERAILGSCLKRTDNFEQLLLNGIIKEDFYNSTHQVIYEAFIKTYSKHGAIDLVLVASENKDIQVSYLAQLFSSVFSNIDMKAHLNVLMSLSINRKYMEIAKGIQKGEIQDIGQFIKAETEKIEILKSRVNSSSTIITLDKVKPINIYDSEKINTGFIDIDAKILGFVMGSLDVITGYNGNGKSTLINQMCIAESLSQGYKVFAYSPELTNSNLKSWLYPTIANECHFATRDFHGIRYKAVGEIGISQIDNWIADKLYIYTDNSTTSSGDKLLRDMEYMAIDKGVRVFIIDNLMKIDIEESYKNELLAQKTFVNKLKEFSRKHNSVVHLVAHPRKPQQGNSGKISKFDIAGTGDITNLADYVVAVRRVTDEEKLEDMRSKNPFGLKDCIIKVMKDRPKGSNEFYINLNFDKDRKRFYSSLSELNKDYGYINKLDMFQVEMGEYLFEERNA